MLTSIYLPESIAFSLAQRRPVISENYCLIFTNYDIKL